ncbi:MAG TPA: sugar phosphate isomerase/epimerase [Planctomycetota bacterium]|nr:sugar phosphate isomerase/epimerase [Planctomycetota bacterium]
MELGIFSTTFKRKTLNECIEAVAASGLRAVQFDLLSAGVPEDASTLTPELAKSIAAQHAARGIRIAGINGCFNMAHPDSKHRREGVAYLRRLAARCSDLGTDVITLCTGTRHPECMWWIHPENESSEAWCDMAATMVEAAKTGEEFNVTMAFEPEVSNIINTPQKARKLLDEIRSPRLKVCMDGANIFLKGQLPRMKEVLTEAFDLLGSDIAIAHAKDLDKDGEAGQKAAGEGKLDYALYCELFRKVGFTGAVVLHGLSEAQVPRSVAFVRSKL